MIYEGKIKVTADTEGLKETIDKSKELGKVTEENAKKFKKAHEDHKAQMSAAGKATEHFGDQIKDIGNKIVAAFAIESLFEFTKELTKSAEESEKTFKELQFAITGVNKESTSAFKELVEQSERLSKSLNNLYSPKQIQQAQAQLARAGLASKQIMEAIPRIADLSAKSGRSMEAVSEAFIAGINGQSRGLKDFGAKFKDTGDKAENFNRIMEKTVGFTGGAADAMGDLASKSAEAANQQEIMSEKLGAKLAPAWEGIKAILVETLGQLVGIDSEQDRIVERAKMHQNALESVFGKKKGETDAQNDARIQKQRRFAIEDLATQRKLQIQLEEELRLGKERNTLNADGIKMYEEQIKKTAENIAFGVTEVKGLQVLIDKRKEAQEAQEEAAKKTKALNRDLSKFSIEDLKKRIEGLQDESATEIKYTAQKLETIDSLNDAGRQKEIARTQKMIDEKKKEYETYIKMIENFAKQLEQIRRQIAEEEAKSQIDMIQDETAKKLAQEDDNFRKEQDRMKDTQDKLLEIQKKGNDRQKAQATSLLKDLDKDKELAEEAHEARTAKIMEEANQKEIEAAQKHAEEMLKLQEKENDVQAKALLIGLKQRLADKKITQEQYDVEADKIELGRLMRQQQMEADAGHDTIDLDQKIAEQRIKIQEDLAKKTKKVNDKALEDIKTFAEGVGQIYTAMVNARIQGFDQEISFQKEMIQQQTVLAAAGKKNDLAFEMKRQADLEKARAQEQKKLIKIKELEVFLNSVAAFSKEDPKSAIFKAIAQLAIIKGVEASYMEEGGMIGERRKMTRVDRRGLSRVHPGGGDVLIHAQRGEAILSKNQVRALGGPAAFHKLQNILNLNERSISPAQVFAMAPKADKDMKEIKQVLETIRDQPRQHIDVNALNQLVETRYKEGMKEVWTYVKSIKLRG
jgi:hypothetical protein